MTDIRSHNREAWNHQVESGNKWTLPVNPEEIAAARAGQVRIVLTPTIPVPLSWYPPLEGAETLCLASGGGQQGPILAAAGARVTVFDNSPRQLEQDRQVAEREDLEISTVEGDMRDLSVFENEHFDLIIHPVSNLFVPEIQPVWDEAFRVMKPGGVLLSGFCNPIRYIFDEEKADREGVLEAIHKLPYSDVESLTEAQKEGYRKDGMAFEFSHTLDAQIGGQLQAGFLLRGFYEDTFSEDVGDLLSEYSPSFLATCAVKL